MNLSDHANTIYESTRSLLLSTEPISKKIDEISHSKLRDRLQEIFRTCQADLLILNDFLIEIINCETEEEIEFLIENNTEFTELVS